MYFVAPIDIYQFCIFPTGEGECTGEKVRKMKEDKKWKGNEWIGSKPNLTSFKASKTQHITCPDRDKTDSICCYRCRVCLSWFHIVYGYVGLHALFASLCSRTHIFFCKSYFIFSFNLIYTRYVYKYNVYILFKKNLHAECLYV